MSGTLRWLLCRVGLVVVAVGIFGVSSAAAATVPLWRAASEFGALPSNAITTPGGQSAGFDQISCTSRGNCAGVGYYNDTSHNQQAMVANQSGGVWGAASPLSLPGAISSTYDYLQTVSCAAPGNCTAGGAYQQAGGAVQAMVASESNGSWGQATELSPPVNAATPSSQNASIYGVSCSAPGDCVAGGWYLDSSGLYQGMVLSESGGVWAQATEVSLPGNAERNYAWIASLTCASAGNCVAGGQYEDTAGGLQAMVVSETNGVWGQATELSGPSNSRAEPSSSGSGNVVYGLSCPSAGNCAASGYYEDTGGSYQSMVATETGGVWGQATELSLPGNAATTAGGQSSAAYGLSCTSQGNCALGGYYTDTTGGYQTMVATESGGTWGQAQELSLPANTVTGAGNQAASIYGLTCTGPGDCEAGGYYEDTTGSYQAMVVSSVGSLSVASSSLPAATIGVPYSAQLAASGGAGSYSWSKVSGSLPAGLSMSSSGVVSGTPTAVGTSSFGVTVSDPGPPAQQASGTVSLTVGAHPPVTKIVKFKDQKISLTTPSPLACVAKPGKLAVKLSSTRIPHSKAAKLRFVRAAFYIDKGIAHRVHKKVHGKRRVVTVHVANATRKHVPLSLNLSLAGLKAGTHTLSVVITYKETVRKHGHTKTITLTKTIRVKFKVC